MKLSTYARMQALLGIVIAVKESAATSPEVTVATGDAGATTSDEWADAVFRLAPPARPEPPSVADFPTERNRAERRKGLRPQPRKTRR